MDADYPQPGSSRDLQTASRCSLFRQSQAAFATPSISDRIALALWSRRNRTARVLSREKRCKAHPQRSAVLFLRSGFRARIAKLRPYPAISREIQAVFSALQTVWRSRRDSNLKYSFAALSLGMSVSCRSQILPENSRNNLRSELCYQSGFDSPFIRARWANIMRFCDISLHLARRAHLLGSHVTARQGCSHKTKTFSRQATYRHCFDGFCRLVFSLKFHNTIITVRFKGGGMINLRWSA